MRGQMVYMYAYDVAHEIDVQKAREFIAERAQFLEIRPAQGVPRDFPFYKPLLIEKHPVVLKSSVGPLTLHREAKVFAIGAISVSIRFDIDASSFADLMRYHKVTIEGERTIDDVAGDLCRQIYDSIKPYLTKPAFEGGNPEAYTAFCLRDVPDMKNQEAEKWLTSHRREVAGLLTEEAQFEKLSDVEVAETVRCNYSYTTEDLIVLDWNGALIVDHEGKWDDLLYLLEVANVQLTELMLYDRVLESFLDKAYDDVEAYRRKPPILKGPDSVAGHLKEVLMDLTRMSEQITNITKFFGDWHLARVYLGVSERFHLKEWDASVEGKLKALDGLYHRVLTDISNRRMLVLEAAIVFLFVVDLLSIFLKS